MTSSFSPRAENNKKALAVKIDRLYPFVKAWITPIKKRAAPPRKETLFINAIALKEPVISVRLSLFQMGHGIAAVIAVIIIEGNDVAFRPLQRHLFIIRTVKAITGITHIKLINIV